MGRPSFGRPGRIEDFFRGSAFFQLSFSTNQNLNPVFVSPTLRRDQQPENSKKSHHRHWSNDLGTVDRLFFQRGFPVQVHLSLVPNHKKLNLFSSLYNNSTVPLKRHSTSFLRIRTPAFTTPR